MEVPRQEELERVEEHRGHGLMLRELQTLRLKEQGHGETGTGHAKVHCAKRNR